MWRACDARAVQQGKMDAREFQHGEEHDAAFLEPVPFCSPTASVGAGAGVCAVVSERLFTCLRFGC